MHGLMSSNDPIKLFFPTKKAGLQINDQIVRVNNINFEMLKIREAIDILHKSTRIDMVVKRSNRNNQYRYIRMKRSGFDVPFGFRVRLNDENGIIVSKIEKCMKNLEVGDVIVEINGKSLETCGLDDVIKIFSLSLVVDMKVKRSKRTDIDMNKRTFVDEWTSTADMQSDMNVLRLLDTPNGSSKKLMTEMLIQVLDDRSTLPASESPGRLLNSAIYKDSIRYGTYKTKTQSNRIQHRPDGLISIKFKRDRNPVGKFGNYVPSPLARSHTVVEILSDCHFPQGLRLCLSRPTGPDSSVPMEVLSIEPNSAASGIFEPGMVLMRLNNVDFTQMKTIAEAEDFIERAYKRYDTIYFQIKAAKQDFD